MNFLLWNTVTKQECGGAGAANEDRLPDAPENCVWHPIDGEFEASTLAEVDGAIVEIPRPLALIAVKMAKASAADDYLSARMAGSCMTDIGLVQCDKAAQDNLNVEVQAASLIGASYSMPWRKTDNTFSPPLNAPQLVALAMQVRVYVKGCKFANWAAKDAIEAAASVEAAQAVDVTAGYPS